MVFLLRKLVHATGRDTRDKVSSSYQLDALGKAISSLTWGDSDNL
jgi:hypothetical protein